MSRFNIRLRDPGGNLVASFQTGEELRAYFGETHVVYTGVLSDTTAGWDSQTDLVSQKNIIYVYTDHLQETDEEGNVINVPGIKIGDGLAYLIDLPFTDDLFTDHINDRTVHVTQEEREFWNNKNRAYVSSIDEETLVLTKD